MPTAGVHITIIERLALRAEWRDLLGDPHADVSDPAGLQMRYAKLGAVGPDLFYAMLDYGPGLEDLGNFVAKTAGSFACIGDTMGKVDAFISSVESDVTLGLSDSVKAIFDEITSSFGMVSKVVNEGLLALLVDKGYNFFTVFEPRREDDKPRENWFWADYLHYVRTGEFVRQLFLLAGDDRNLRAYAYGYLSHYVTDVVGHPYVNQVTGAPWRLYWQRHHLVENFIDAYVWPRWHSAEIGGVGEEPPLDRVLDQPNQDVTTGAPFTFSRLNDHIDIGDPVGADPVDQLIEQICKTIDDGLEDIGLAEPDPIPPGNPSFVAWANMMAQVFRTAYPDEARPPTNLAGLGRPDGYPTAADVGQAYSLLRLVFRFATEDTVSEPAFPDVLGDVWQSIEDVANKVADDFAGIEPPPGFGGGGHFSLKSAWNWLKHWARTAADAAAAIGHAALDIARGIIHTFSTALLDGLKIALYLFKRALWELYRIFRHILVRLGYAVPLTEELSGNVVGDLAANSLWVSPGNRPAYFVEFVERQTIGPGAPYSTPFLRPEQLPEYEPPAKLALEEPPCWVAPYSVGSLPDVFIDEPLGKRAMLDPDGPAMTTLPPVGTASPGGFPGDFGGAMENCREAFKRVAAVGHHPPVGFFPDYNLDGDRGYGWPCWDVGPNAGLHPRPWGSSVQVSPEAIKSATA